MGRTKRSPLRQATSEETAGLSHVTWIYHPTLSTRWAFYIRDEGDNSDRLVCWREKGRSADVQTHIIPALIAGGYLPRRFRYESYHAFSHHLGGWPRTDHLIHALDLSVWDADLGERGSTFYLDGLQFAEQPRYSRAEDGVL
jgi:hypothetical protein